MESQNTVKAESKTLDKLTLSDILAYLLKYYYIIILGVLLGAAVGLILQTIASNKEVKPQYSASATMSVTAKSTINLEDGEPVYSTASDLTVAKQIIPTVTALVKQTDRVTGMLADLLNDSTISASAVKNAITLTNITDTTFIEVSIKWPDEQESVAIVNALMEVLPQAMLDTINIGGVTVIDYATKATPVYDIPTQYILVTTLIGLVAGVGVAILLGIMSPKLRTQEDVKELLKLDTVAELPYSHDKTGNNLFTDGEISIEYREACSVMSSIFGFIASKESLKTIYVTSSVSGEGKSTVSINLALALAQKKKNVILIDADTRRPTIGDKLGIPDTVPSLQNVLGDPAMLSDALYCIGEHLLALRSEITAEPINGDQLKPVIDIIKTYSDYIIVDTPPVGLVSDALALNPVVDGVLFVVKQDYANMGIIAESVNMVSDSGASIIGCVINAKHSYLTGRYYTKGKYYHSYRNSGYDYGKSGYGYGKGKYGERGYYYRSRYYRKHKGGDKPEDPVEQFKRDYEAGEAVGADSGADVNVNAQIDANANADANIADSGAAGDVKSGADNDAQTASARVDNK